MVGVSLPVLVVVLVRILAFPILARKTLVDWWILPIVVLAVAVMLKRMMETSPIDAVAGSTGWLAVGFVILVGVAWGLRDGYRFRRSELLTVTGFFVFQKPPMRVSNWPTTPARIPESDTEILPIEGGRAEH